MRCTAQRAAWQGALRTAQPSQNPAFSHGRRLGQCARHRHAPSRSDRVEFEDSMAAKQAVDENCDDIGMGLRTTSELRVGSLHRAATPGAQHSYPSSRTCGRRVGSLVGGYFSCAGLICGSLV